MPENPQEEGHSDVLEILPLNAEQKKAVSKAISNDITVVTGPPGTGKSQVVISILIKLSQYSSLTSFSADVLSSLSELDKEPNVRKQLQASL